MKEKIKDAPNHILITTMSLTAMVLVIAGFLSVFHIYFRREFWSAAAVLFVIGFSLGSYQSISRQQKLDWQSASTIATPILAVCFLMSMSLVMLFGYPYEYVEAWGDTRYVVRVHSVLKSNVTYYEYMNPVVMGTRRVSFWVDGTYRPGDGYLTGSSYSYYDERGRQVEKENFQW